MERHDVPPMGRIPRGGMCVSVLEAGFLWRVRVLQGPAARREAATSALQVLGAGEMGKPQVTVAVSLIMVVTPIRAASLL